MVKNFITILDSIILMICAIYRAYHYAKDDININCLTTLLNKIEHCNIDDMCSYDFNIIYNGREMTVPVKERLYFKSNIGNMVTVSINNPNIHHNMIELAFFEFLFFIFYCAFVTQRFPFVK